MENRPLVPAGEGLLSRLANRDQASGTKGPTLLSRATYEPRQKALHVGAAERAGGTPFVPARSPARDRRVPAAAGIWAVSLPRQGILFFSFFSSFQNSFRIFLRYYIYTVHVRAYTITCLAYDRAHKYIQCDSYMEITNYRD